MRKLILGLSLAALFASGARADFTGKDASGATITFKNSGVCTSVVCVAQFQPVDSTGAAFGVTGNPFFISFGTGVTLPAYASTPTFNLGTLNGAATASNQSSQITQETAINTVLGTQADTAWVSGSGTAISILKNIAGGVGGSIPAGSNLIGKVGIDQTTPNTTNAISVAQIAGTTTATGSGAMNGGTQRTALATDSPGIINFGQVAMSASVPVAIASNQSAVPVTLSGITTDPCQGSTKSYLPITATTSLVKVIATGVSAKKIYICQLLLTTTAANNVAVFEATTGTTCATSAVAVYGAGTSVATAANGFPFPANGGVSLGGGGFSIAQTSVNANDLCIGTSAATPLTGGISYVTQ